MKLRPKRFRRTSRAQWWADAFRLAATVACLLALLDIVTGRGVFTSVRPPDVWPFPLAVAALAYAASHAIRAIRLTLLVGEPAMPLKRLMSLHLFTAGLGVLLPWKGSELIRVGELAATLETLPRAVAIVWIERAFDFAATTVLYLTLAAFGGAVGGLGPLVMLWGVFVLVSIFLFRAMPENVRRLKLFIIQRYRGETAGRLLRMLNGALAISQAGQESVRLHAGTVALLTSVIWVLELTAFGLATRPGSVAVVIGGLLDVLAAVPGGARFVASDLASYISLRPGIDPAALGRYQAVVAITTLALGAAFGAIYLIVCRMERRADLAALRMADYLK